MLTRVLSSCTGGSSRCCKCMSSSTSTGASSMSDLLLRGVRPFSSTAAASKATKKAPKEKKSKGDVEEKVKKPRAAAPNPVGKLYHVLLHRSRGANQLALGDLRKLLEQCKGPDELKYATHAVALYQRKGQDFSEEVNSHFISACIRGGQPAVAAAELAKYACRIGAWTTPAAFERLVASLEAQGQAGELLPALPVLARKGVLLKKDSVALLLRDVAAAGDAEAYEKAVDAAAKLLGDADAKAVVAEHPLKVEKVEEAPAAAAAAAADAEAAGDAPAAAAAPAEAPAADAPKEAPAAAPAAAAGKDPAALAALREKLEKKKAEAAAKAAGAPPPDAPKE